MLPFVRTGMTQEYADNPKVFGRWQPRMLEPHECALAVSQLLGRDPAERDLHNFELQVDGTAQAPILTWSDVRLDVVDSKLPWSEGQPIQCSD